jgi:uncharacterized repeat protein (TIGR01451 family)
VTVRASLLVAAALLLAGPVSAQDLSVVNSALQSAQPGGPIVYFINVKNAGAAATNVTFTDVIPPNTTFISESHPSAATCSTPEVGGTGTVSCTMTALSGTVQFFLEVQVDAAAAQGTIISDTASVTSSNDPNSANNSATTTVPVSGALYVTTDVAVASSGPPTALAGAEIGYTVTVVNKGPVDAANVAFVDAIPATATLVSVVQTSGPPFACTTAPPGSRGGVRCAVDRLGNGASATFNVTVRVDPGCPSTSIHNDVSITSDTANLIGPKEDRAETLVTSVPGSTADVAISIRKPRSVPPGALINSYIDVINTGPADASDVTFSFDVPPETWFMDVTPPDGITCSAPAAASRGIVTCNVPKLLNEQTMTFVMSIEVSTKPAVASIAETAKVATGMDPDMTYNSATATVLIDVADLSIRQRADKFFVAAGRPVTFTIEVTNGGPATASGVTVSDSIPSGATLVSVSAAQGVCNAASCSFVSLASGATATVTVTIDAPDAPGRIINSAAVKSTTADASSKNNASTAAVMVVIPVKK